MFYLLRLIIVLTSLFSGTSFAALPLEQTYCRNGQEGNMCGTKGTRQGAYTDWLNSGGVLGKCSDGSFIPPNVYLVSETESRIEFNFKRAGCPGYPGDFDNENWNIRGNFSSVGSRCPADSVQSGSSCVCKSEFNEVGGICIPKKDSICGSLTGMSLGISSMESDFGPQSAQWAAGKLGKSGNSCLSGCQTSGGISSCVAGTGKTSSTVCFLSNPSFTGEKCSEPDSAGSGGEGNEGGKDNPSDCPAGYEPSKYALGVCIPKPNDCPSGSSPSKYAEGVCIPDEKGDDGSCEDPKDPTKRAECEGSKNKCPSGQVQSTTQVGTCVPGTDSLGKDKDGNKVECKNGKCTVTKPDGSKEDKDQKSVCAENPDLPACKENKSTFGGTCMGGFSCDGDALQCAIGKEQHRRNCELFEKDTDSNSLTNKALNGTDDKSADALKASAAQLNVTSTFDQSGLGWSHSCPADPRIPLGFGGSNTEFTIPFSRICGPLGVLSLAGVGITLLGCGVWVLGGKKGG